MSSGPHRYRRSNWRGYQRPERPPPESARQLLVDWANEQDGWVRQLVGVVMASRAAIDGETLEAVFMEFLAESKLIQQDPQVVPWVQRVEETGQREAAIRLDSISGLDGVNALAAGQRIDFDPKITVLFGENGSGKSGYTRLLKQLADSRSAETILSNVYEADRGVARATIVFTVDELQHQVEWRSGQRVGSLSRMAVFDDAAVQPHLDSELSYTYTPGDLVLFPAVAASISAVRSRLDGEIATRRPRENAFASRFTPGTRVFNLISELGAATDVLALSQLASVTEQEAASLDELAGRIAALQSAQTAPAQLMVERLRRDRLGRLLSAAAAVAAFDADSYNDAVRDAKDAEERYGRLARRLLAGAGIEGADTGAWKEFLDAAEHYGAHVSSSSYPQVGDRCLYCREPLSDAAVSLLRSYREFANDAQRRRAADARTRATALSRELLRLDCERLAEELRGQTESRSSSEPSGGEALMLALGEQQIQIRAGEPVQWSELNQLALDVTRECKAEMQGAEKLIKDLSTEAQERAQALAAAQAHHAQLKDRLELARCLNEVIASIERARWVARGGELKGRFSTLQRSFTDAAKAIGEQFINGDFSRRFTEECIALSAPTVRLDFPGRQGRTGRQKTVAAKRRPSTVLSHGEQRLIAIADFLAEAMMCPASAPVVFDDPSCGLDRTHAGYLAERLAVLSRERQVIVLTHDSWFVEALLGRVESFQDRYTYYNVLDQPEPGMIVAAGSDQLPRDVDQLTSAATANTM